MIPVGGEMVMCSRCPKAMYAHLTMDNISTCYVTFYCEDCDGPGRPTTMADTGSEETA